MSKKSATTTAKIARRGAQVKAAAPAKKPASAAKKVISRAGGVAVPAATVDGYAVFASPVRPVHFTSEQIAEAIAELS